MGETQIKREAPLTEAAFCWARIENQMAGEKLNEGIWLSHLDTCKLRHMKINRWRSG
ncbi:hypothetical protein [Deinococcus hopiensis]|uniref:hypothetical protein n=1 Tax=Deinococcus hopiensis TaxID=309885 RepID=UPI0014825B39|nr:hypothetical protein [Deinococcus hopiensis]